MTALNHLVRRERRVRLGGVQLWPLRARLGGRWYTVGPLSLLRWLQYAGACVRVAGAFGPDPEASLRAARPLLHLAVLEPVRPADYRRATDAQAAAVGAALAECNDIPYLLAHLSPEGAREAWEGDAPDDDPSWLGDVPWDWVDSLDSVAEARPRYTLEDLKLMPAEQFFALQDAVAKKAKVRARAVREATGTRSGGAASDGDLRDCGLLVATAAEGGADG